MKQIFYLEDFSDIVITPIQVNLNQLIGQGIHKEVIISKSKALDGLGHLYLMAIMAIRLFLFAYAPPGLTPNRLPSMLL